MKEKNFKYIVSHEWVDFLDEKTAYIGITDYAQGTLGDIVFINLPEVGSTINLTDAFGELESVKAVSDLFSPVAGVVLEVNEAIVESPELINENAYDNWILKIGDISETSELLSYDQYEALEKE